MTRDKSQRVAFPQRKCEGGQHDNCVSQSGWSDAEETQKIIAGQHFVPFWNKSGNLGFSGSDIRNIPVQKIHTVYRTLNTGLEG